MTLVHTVSYSVKKTESGKEKKVLPQRSDKGNKVKSVFCGKSKIRKQECRNTQSYRSDKELCFRP